MNRLFKNYFDFIKRLIPNQAEETSVGLDIGTNECRLVEIGKSKSSGSFELINWNIEPIEQGNVRLAVEKSLKKLTTPNDAPYTAIFGKGTLIRYIDMPKMSLTDLKNALSIEAEKYFPFPQDQIYIDCCILNTTGSSKRMSVLAAAAKKDLVEARMKFLNDMGLRVNFIGIDPVALVNVLSVVGMDSPQENNTADGSVFAIVDLGDLVSNLTIVVNQLPCFSRDISVGGKRLNQSISNALEVSEEEAEKLRFNPGKKADQILAACESSITTLTEEMRISFDYFATEKNMDVKQVFLTGGGFIQGLPEVLNKDLEISAQQWDPLKPLIKSHINAEGLGKKSYKLGTALGLALYQYA